MRYAWIAVKVLLSAVLVSAAIIITFLVLASDRKIDPVGLGLVAFLFFFAALPWISQIQKSPRSIGLVGIFVAILFAMSSYDAWFGNSVLPKDCSSYRQKLACHFINEIYEMSGHAGVAALWAVLAGLLLWGSVRSMNKSRREHA